MTTRYCISAPEWILRKEPQTGTQYLRRDLRWQLPRPRIRHAAVVCGAWMELCDDFRLAMNTISVHPSNCACELRFNRGSRCHDTTVDCRRTLRRSRPALPQDVVATGVNPIPQLFNSAILAGSIGLHALCDAVQGPFARGCRL